MDKIKSESNKRKREEISESDSDSNKSDSSCVVIPNLGNLNHTMDSDDSSIDVQKEKLQPSAKKYQKTGNEENNDKDSDVEILEVIEENEIQNSETTSQDLDEKSVIYENHLADPKVRELYNAQYYFNSDEEGKVVCTFQYYSHDVK